MSEHTSEHAPPPTLAAAPQGVQSSNWGKLISTTSKNPTLSMSGETFTVHMVTGDPSSRVRELFLHRRVVVHLFFDPVSKLKFKRPHGLLGSTRNWARQMAGSYSEEMWFVLDLKSMRQPLSSTLWIIACSQRQIQSPPPPPHIAQYRKIFFSTKKTLVLKCYPPKDFSDLESERGVSALDVLWRKFGDNLQGVSRTLSEMPMREKYKEDLRRRIIDPEHVNITLENFLYHLSKETKELLLASSFIHLQNRMWAKFYHIYIASDVAKAFVVRPQHQQLRILSRNSYESLNILK